MGTLGTHNNYIYFYLMELTELELSFTPKPKSKRVFWSLTP